MELCIPSLGRSTAFSIMPALKYKLLSKADAGKELCCARKLSYSALVLWEISILNSAAASNMRARACLTTIT